MIVPETGGADGSVASSAWNDAVRAAALVAVDPRGCGGVVLRAGAGPVRDRWLDLLRSLVPEAMPLRRVPAHVSDARLLGSLDLAATLRAGRPVAERGLIAEANGGLLLVGMAERLAPAAAGMLSAALDAGTVSVEREGLSLRQTVSFGVVALDEGLAPDEHPPEVLLERLALRVDLTPVGVAAAAGVSLVRADIDAARLLLPEIDASESVVEALCAAAAVLGVASLRAPLLALCVARAAAALDGRRMVAAEDAATAARLVLAPRATTVPAAGPQADGRPTDETPADDADPASPSEGHAESTEGSAGMPDKSLGDIVLAAAQASIPSGLLAQIRLGGAVGRGAASAGRAGAQKRSARRGRPAGARPGKPGGTNRLALVETLRAAAPWQPLRQRDAAQRGLPSRRVLTRAEDFRVRRFKHRAESATIFVVDASGSAALHRLAEAKGAVELLLADCYARRDQVSVVAFRGRGADLLLPPTRSLVRAKRSLAGLPGGGGTPLAAGIDAAAAVAAAAARRGQTPVLVLLTDGRANVARDGSGGRQRAEAEALQAAEQVRAGGIAAILLDTAPQPQPPARRLAEAMGARYVPLPQADAAILSRAVRAGMPTAG
ncbi:MAG: magnesium chelatase subunit D [Alphaproteobacteria bacterium]|nr:magnesium chelatase subunit D [Alphaproteobacteria bacterium]